jgi:hypothetical protein
MLDFCVNQAAEKWRNVTPGEINFACHAAAGSLSRKPTRQYCHGERLSSQLNWTFSQRDFEKSSLYNAENGWQPERLPHTFCREEGLRPRRRCFLG